TVRVSGSMLRFTDYESVLTVEGGTLRAALDHVIAAHPAMAEVLYGRDGALRRTFRVCLNGEVLGKDPLDTPIGPADHVDLLLAISGG
ncbi:MoaD/ThiS family protein, partial [Sinosporangium siamense]